MLYNSLIELVWQPVDSWRSWWLALSSEEVHLRHVETDVLIPKMMREKAKELCADKVDAFTHCCKESGILMAFKCRKENSALKDCLIHHYQNPGFFEECKQQYIQEKLEYEKTGIPAKHRGQKLPASM
uniref:COX assembly mitochondrial protein n=1 Tax=Oryzias latipes TaxID=8090 RepID=A0A3B3ICZ0_ORYLA